MGKPKIFLRPTSIFVKQAGFMKKLFLLWDKNIRKSKRQKMDMMEGSLNRKPIEYSGIPNFLEQRKGLNTKVTTRRQIVMNRNFTEVVSEILLNNNKLDVMNSGITITSIETKAWNKGVDIFYYRNNKAGAQTFSQETLNQLIGDIRAAITEQRFIGRTPEIRFVLDKSITQDEIMSNAFEKLEQMSTAHDYDDRLIETISNPLEKVNKESKYRKQFKAHEFSCPHDMTNCMFGLDYPKLYNTVASKMERGRAISERTSMDYKVTTACPPFIRGPPVDPNELDPMQRVINMQKFLINQRKKTERIGRERRLQEILDRDASRWVEEDPQGAPDCEQEKYSDSH